MSVKIIQLVATNNVGGWEGVLLGLGDNGVVYEAGTGRWKPIIPPIGYEEEGLQG